jgi:hypothetical protein
MDLWRIAMLMNIDILNFSLICVDDCPIRQVKQLFFPRKPQRGVLGGNRSRPRRSRPDAGGSYR